MATPDRPTRPAPRAETVATVSFGPLDASPADLSVLGYAFTRTSGVLSVDIDFSRQTITAAFDPAVASEVELGGRASGPLAIFASRSGQGQHQRLQ